MEYMIEYKEYRFKFFDMNGVYTVCCYVIFPYDTPLCTIEEYARRDLNTLRSGGVVLNYVEVEPVDD
ncbi:MAG: hypothetical protein LBL79_01260 [Prevotella sp.]|nr:hypothetical protein [Prevotella sp.]